MNSKNKATLSFSWPLELIPFVAYEKEEGLFYKHRAYYFLFIKLVVKIAAKDIMFDDFDEI